jgi:hypothetical protein
MADQTLFSRLSNKVEKLVKSVRLKASIKQIYGPQQFDLAPDDVVVVVMVKDGAFYVDAFFEHYRALGAKHFVFIDNGSSDGTITQIKAQAGTVILRSTLPMKTYESEFRRHGAQSFARNHWVLYADVDELFDFQGSDALGLSGLARYLTGQGYTALMAQMLDVFPVASIQSYAQATFEQAIADYRYYDLSQIVRYDYTDDTIAFSYFMGTNTPSSDALKFMFGGVRNKIFGEMCCLTKHPLVFVDDKTWPNPHPHVAAHVRVADFSAVIKHYKFTDDPFARDLQTLRDGTLTHGENKLRLDVIANSPDISFYSEDALQWGGVEPLYAQGFLVQSPVFTDFVTRERGRLAAKREGVV